METCAGGTDGSTAVLIVGLSVLCLQPSQTRAHHHVRDMYRDADKSLARPGRKQVTAKEDFEFHIAYL